MSFGRLRKGKVLPDISGNTRPRDFRNWSKPVYKDDIAINTQDILKNQTFYMKLFIVQNTILMLTLSCEYRICCIFWHRYWFRYYLWNPLLSFRPSSLTDFRWVPYNFYVFLSSYLYGRPLDSTLSTYLETRSPGWCFHQYPSSSRTELVYRNGPPSPA